MIRYRAVRPSDTSRLCEIRQEAAAGELASLTPGGMAAQLREISRMYPVLAAEVDGRIEAYAFAAPLRYGQPFQWSAEVRLYVDAAHRRQGLGTALLLRLMRVLSVQGFLQLHAAVVLPDSAALSFLESFDFAQTGRIPCAAVSQGQWSDLMGRGRPLAQMPELPAPPTPFSSFEYEELAAMIL